jgi:hypothetical protein
MQAQSQTPSNKTVVIVAYKPKAGKESDLLQLTREHVPLLRAEGLATDHPVTACLARDGTVVEVFEWAPAAPNERTPTPLSRNSGPVTPTPATSFH